MDTIAAIATPLAPSAIGILRLSGADCAAIAARVFSSRLPLEAQPRTLCYGAVRDDAGRTVDRALAVYFPQNASYTGEPSVELYCHGSPVVLTEALRALLAAGARQAQAGEFTRRAFLNGRMDLTQAEAVGDLLTAETAAAARNACAQMEGALGRILSGVYDSLLTLSSRFYAVVDYPDEEIADQSAGEMQEILSAAAATLTRLLATYARGQLLKNGISAVLIGRPNVGKSSLLNAFLGKNRAIVTQTAGTTRDTLEERLLLGELVLSLTDTAGVRESDDEIEREGVQRAKDAAASAHLALLVVDGSLPPTAEDEAAALAAQAAEQVLVLRNKADLPPNAALLQRFPNALPLSAKSGEGLAEVSAAIAALFPLPPLTDGSLLTNLRQADAATRARDALLRAAEGLSAGLTPDAALTDVEEALTAIGELTGKSAREDVVARIFEKFCVGK